MRPTDDPEQLEEIEQDLRREWEDEALALGKALAGGIDPFRLALNLALDRLDAELNEPMTHARSRCHAPADSPGGSR